MTFANLGSMPKPAKIYPDWNEKVIELVERAICEAWFRVSSHYPQLLAQTNADEDAITDQLKTELVALRKTNTPTGFNDELFGIPTRDSKLANVTGTSIDAMPDLTIHLAKSRAEVQDDQHDALFFECKVLDSTRTLNLYDKYGIQRFIKGWYAGHMPHAGMVAYVLKSPIKPANKCPATSLNKYMDKIKAGCKVKNSHHLKCKLPLTKVMLSPNTAIASDIAKSVHKRPSSESISLRHLWLFP